MIPDPQDKQSVTTADGQRTLAFEITGDPQGVPIFLLHGTPGSRSGPKPRSVKLDQMGVRLIGYDRPGYGDSTRDPGRSVADAAEDVARIADALGIGQFAVVGRSGGAPHALACAALLRSRVTRVAALVSIAPRDAEGLDWFHGMNGDNAREHGASARDVAERAKAVAHAESLVVDSGRVLLDSIRRQIVASDERVVEDVEIRRLLLRTYDQGLMNGTQGWIDDIVAFKLPWRINLGDIVAPVKLWHGENDHFSPTEHSRWLAKHIPGATLEIEPGTGHFGAMEVLPDILPWLAEGLPRAPAPLVIAAPVADDPVPAELPEPAQIKAVVGRR